VVICRNQEGPVDTRVRETPAMSSCGEVRKRKKERKKERKRRLLDSVMSLSLSLCSSIRMEKLAVHWTDFY
jgi:hypothetical protein